MSLGVGFVCLTVDIHVSASADRPALLAPSSHDSDSWQRGFASSNYDDDSSIYCKD